MLDITIAYSIIWPQEINFIGVDDAYYQDNYYYKVRMRLVTYTIPIGLEISFIMRSHHHIPPSPAPCG